ncbi:hypothetical protein HXX76_003111 [Chlamydomonas incerta]|uniref:Uncharacterized protein n=1 Tax=Chlamydomonas incerta TaxID=51695 RepID=A0A835T9V2_CHLIN|nr:hypothetical protein HXX76_003111 [Chlamydomonas incerta]|eukprot:KAG2441489.1 hypothetical protein HXX76_003111 [Chlamydomonas incerta]
MDGSFALWDLEDDQNELELSCGVGSLRGDLRETCALRLQAAHKPPPSRLGAQLLADVKDIIGQLGPGPYVQSQLPALAARLLEQGYDVSVREALGGGSECFKSLRHSFLVVRGRGEYEGMEFIVEAALRAHFTIPHPSPDYEQMLARAPDVFVGGSCRLAPLVQLLCALMADSFERQGLALPPWRKEAAMLSKWLPAAGKTRELRPVSRSRPVADATPSAESSQTGYGVAPTASSRDCLDFNCAADTPGSGAGSASASAAAAPGTDAAVAGGSPVSVFAVTGAFSPVPHRVGAGGLNAGPYGFGAGAIAAVALHTAGMNRCHSEPPVLQFGFQLPAVPAVNDVPAEQQQQQLTQQQPAQVEQQQEQAHRVLAAEAVRLGRFAAAVPHVAVVASKDAAAAACGYAAWCALPVIANAGAGTTAGLVKADALGLGLGSISGGGAAMSLGGASCCDCGCGSADGSARSALGLGLGCMTGGEEAEGVRDGSSRYAGGGGHGGGAGFISSLGTGVMIDCCDEDEDGLVEAGGGGGSSGWHRSTVTGMLPAPCTGEGGRRSLDEAKAVLLGGPGAAAAAAAAAALVSCGAGDKAGAVTGTGAACRPQPRRQPSEREVLTAGGGGLAALMAAAAATTAAAAPAAAHPATGVVERRPPVHPAAPAIHLVRRGAQHATAGSRSCSGNEAAAAAPGPQQPQQPEVQVPQPMSARPQSQPQPRAAHSHSHSQAEHPLHQQFLAFQRQHYNARGASKPAVAPIAAAATAATVATAVAATASSAAGMRALSTVPPQHAAAAGKSWLPWKLPAHYYEQVEDDGLQQAGLAAAQNGRGLPAPQLMPW